MVESDSILSGAQCEIGTSAEEPVAAETVSEDTTLTSPDITAWSFEIRTFFEESFNELEVVVSLLGTETQSEVTAATDDPREIFELIESEMTVETTRNETAVDAVPTAPNPNWSGAQPQQQQPPLQPQPQPQPAQPFPRAAPALESTPDQQSAIGVGAGDSGDRLANLKRQIEERMRKSSTLETEGRS